ncbi:MAG: ASCH domain-containing protein [Roseiflexaceae bacterium]
MQTIERYWQAFLHSLPPESPYRQAAYQAEGWGDSPEMADEPGHLIAIGTKTATCSALWEYQAEGTALPEVGTLTIVLDGQDQPLCIIETTEVSIRAYGEVDADFAAAEGEGDRSLSFWRTAHWHFFSRTLAAIGHEPSEAMPLVCERFRRIFPHQPEAA